MPDKIKSAEQLRDGKILLIDKPYAWSSFDVVNKIKSVCRHHLGLKKIKIGHAGTLDPLATGLMVIAIGKATKGIEALMSESKSYRATVRLGGTTPSFDLETSVDALYPYRHITRENVVATLDSFKGTTMQTPPAFSAKRVKGKRAYELARKGEEVVLKDKPVTVNNIELTDFDLPVFTFEVECSKGTYIRSMARDIGTKLDSGGYLTQLRRLSSGEFSVNDAMTIDEVVVFLKEIEPIKE